jgi:hypothetical protein
LLETLTIAFLAGSFGSCLVQEILLLVARLGKTLFTLLGFGTVARLALFD